ncbi:interleukin-17F-like [Genypterus blacodes]|uniref:interleukin-17F-like n=1 Tax=Genypterus blacodes TaxID=154954 RepID=UPI003F7757CC
MELLSLKQISIGLLMIFNHHTSASTGASATNATAAAADAAARSPRCISEQIADRRVSRFMKSLRGSVYGAIETHTRSQQEGNTVACRSLSPWKISIEKEDGRIPHEISRAECISNGCFINQKENFSFNSVPVFAEVIVLRKSLCHSDPTRYNLTRHLVRIPVACTCVVPKYAE